MTSSPSFQHDVFISYKHEDRERADCIRLFLASHEIKGWISHVDIPPGSDYSVEISRAISQCGVFLLVLSEAANQDGTQILKEISLANTAKKAIIPIRIDRIEPGDGYNYHLANVQILDAFSTGIENEFLDILRESRLLQAVEFYLKKSVHGQLPVSREAEVKASSGDLTPKASVTPLSRGLAKPRSDEDQAPKIDTWSTRQPPSSGTPIVLDSVADLEGLITLDWSGKNTDPKAKVSHVLKVSQARTVRVKHASYRGASIANYHFLPAGDPAIREVADQMYELEVLCLWYRWKPKNSWMRLKVLSSEFEIVESFTGSVVVNISRD